MDIVTVPRRADEIQIYMRNFASTGTVWVDDLSLYMVDFSLMDGETVLDSAAGLSFHGHSASWNYSVGTQILEQNIYRFDRPPILTARVAVLWTASVNPQILYHIYENDAVKIAAENGITVIQGALYSTPKAILTT